MNYWLNKNQAVKTVSQYAYRLLEEVRGLSHGDPENRNLLIQGDNLEALKALIQLRRAGEMHLHRPPYTHARPSAITTTTKPTI